MCVCVCVCVCVLGVWGGGGGGVHLKLYNIFIALMLENLFLSLTLLYNPSTQVMSVEEGSHYILSSEQYAVIRRLGTLSKENRIPISCCFLEKRMSRLISLVNNEKNLQYKYIDVLKHTCLFVCERFNDFQSPTTEDWRTKFGWAEASKGSWTGKGDVISSSDYRVAKEPHLTVRLGLRKMGSSNIFCSFILAHIIHRSHIWNGH